MEELFEWEYFRFIILKQILEVEDLGGNMVSLDRTLNVVGLG